MVNPLIFNLRMKLNSDVFEIAHVYGTSSKVRTSDKVNREDRRGEIKKERVIVWCVCVVLLLCGDSGALVTVAVQFLTLLLCLSLCIITVMVTVG